MSVIASQECFSLFKEFKTLFLKQGRELEWYHGKVILRILLVSKAEREGFLLSTNHGTTECAYYRL